jgi:hypothetical protein
MASSVPCERVFSGAGLMVTKRRNRLKSDIVEAVQILRFFAREDELMSQSQPSSIIETAPIPVLKADNEEDLRYLFIATASVSEA